MASSLQDAFINAGVVNQQDLDRKKKDKQEEEKRKKDREIIRQQVEDMQKQDSRLHRTPRRPPENPLDRLWRQNRNLMVHLVYAFSPADKGQYAMVAEELKNANCCVCRCKLASKEELFNKIPQFSEISLGHLKDIVEGKLTADKVKADYSKISGGAVLGVVSKDSKSAFCPECHRNFVVWVELALLNGNSQVNRIIDKLRKENPIVGQI